MLVHSRREIILVINSKDTASSSSGYEGVLETYGQRRMKRINYDTEEILDF